MTGSYDLLPLISTRSAPQDMPREAVTVLLGVISGVFQRRQLQRCIWTCPPGMRRLFVIGNQQPDKRYADVWTVNVEENIAQKRSLDVTLYSETGSLSSSIKLWHFLLYASKQPEKLIARADDDVFIAPVALLRYATFLNQRLDRVYAGSFEFYNYIPSELKSTGHGFGSGGSRFIGRRINNCTNSRSARCQGPFAFAKGPLLLLSKSILWDVTQLQVFQSYERRARFHVPAHKIDDDVQLGWWISHVKNTTYVRLKRRQILDYAPYAPLYPAHVLAIHKLPWQCYDFMQTQSVLPPVYFGCTEDVCGDNCLVGKGSRACMMCFKTPTLQESSFVCSSKYKPVFASRVLKKMCSPPTYRL